MLVSIYNLYSIKYVIVRSLCNVNSFFMLINKLVVDKIAIIIYEIIKAI